MVFITAQIELLWRGDPPTKGAELKNWILLMLHFCSFQPRGRKMEGKRKRVSKKGKKNWRKHSNIKDVEEYLEDRGREEIFG